jgi:signal transduction histidine kinase
MMKLPSDYTAEAQKPVYNRLILLAGLVVFCIGLIHLVLGIPGLKTRLLYEQSVFMVLPVAVSLVSIGIAIKVILDSHPYDRLPQWLWPVRYSSVSIPFAIGLYWFVSYIADPSFNMLDMTTYGLHQVSFMSAAVLVLSAFALFMFLVGQESESIIVYWVDIPALIISNIGILALLGHIYEIPMLYAFRMVLPTGVAALVIGGILLLGSLPFRGLLLPLLSDIPRARLMAYFSLIMGLGVLFFGLSSIALFLHGSNAVDTSRLSLAMRHLYTMVILGANFVSIAMTVIALRAIRYFSQSMHYARYQAQAAKRESVIRHVVQTVYSSLELEEVFRQVANQLGLYLNADRCFISRYDQETGRLSPPTQEYLASDRVSSMISTNVGLWDALSEYAAQECHHTDCPFDFHCLVKDLSIHTQTCIREINVQSGLTCPVRYRGRCFAMLFVHQVQRNRVWTEEEKGIIFEVANQAAIAIYQAELFAQEQTAKDALQEYRVLLEQSNRDLEHFATVASHDLQAPLRKIKLFCEQIHAAAKDKLDPDTLDLMRRVDRAIITAQKLVTDLLALSKAANSTRPFSQVDLSAVLHKVLANLDVQIQEKKAQIDVGQLVTLIGDPTQFEQLLQNLIENSLKYQPEGQKPVIKIYSDCQHEQYCELIVEDNGIGFDSAQAERIFQPFERLHGKSSPYEGTGVGLAICKRIAERHQGSIKAQSSPGHGAKFTVRLPYRPKHSEPYLETCYSPANV